MQDRPVHDETNDRDRPEVREEVAVADGGGRSNQHVLRIAGNGRDTADVGRRGQRQQVGNGPEPHAAREVDQEGRQHQANDVVDEECREQPSGEDHRAQQVSRTDSHHQELGDAIEEAGEAQPADDQHHGEEQDDGGEVDGADGVSGADDADGNHQDRADDRRAGAVDLHPRKFSDGEDQVRGREDRIRDRNLQVGHGIED